MRPLDLRKVVAYVNANIVMFHDARLHGLQALDLHKVLKKKNPYLFRAKNMTIAGDFVRDILDAFLSSSEEKQFGDFLEGLAIFIARNTADGRKSAATGIDLEFEKDGVLNLVSVKSGPNWGNSSQHAKQNDNFNKALRVMKASKHGINVEAVLGICYGKTKTSRISNYLKIVGQSFWYFISDNKDLYTDIVEPLGFRAKKHNDAFLLEKAKLINVCTKAFMAEFCEEGLINWPKIVRFSCSNIKE